MNRLEKYNRKMEDAGYYIYVNGIKVCKSKEDYESVKKPKVAEVFDKLREAVRSFLFS
jgi:hypothetical protein